MSYTEIHRRALIAKKMPDNIVRVNKGGLVLSPNIAERFQAQRYTTQGGREGVRIGLAVDNVAQRIKLSPNATDVFSFMLASNSGPDSALYCQQPTEFRRSGMPIGDYLLVGDEQNLEFQLAR